MKIVAKFIGKDSLGYVNGKLYTLKLSTVKAGLFGKDTIVVERIYGGGKCPYSSIISFLSNWDDVRQSTIAEDTHTCVFSSDKGVCGVCLRSASDSQL